MSHQAIRERLDDYIDGLLKVDERRRVDEHLHDCASCRSEVDALRALLARVGDLPRSIEPPRDLWPTIDARTSGRVWRDRSLWSLRYHAAAAAIALIAISSALTAWLVDGDTARPDPRSAASAPVDGAGGVSAGWRAAEDAYLRTTGELAAALEERRGELDPEVIELIEQNLRVIDRAIQESRAALAADPLNRDLIEALSARYQVKIETLQRLSRLTTQL